MKGEENYFFNNNKKILDQSLRSGPCGHTGMATPLHADALLTYVRS